MVAMVVVELFGVLAAHFQPYEVQPFATGIDFAQNELGWDLFY